MVEFVGYERAKEAARTEPVVFAEIVAKHDGASSLEVHVVVPEAERPYEFERDDTGPIDDAEIRGVVARIAADHGARYATVIPAKPHWPPPKSQQKA